MNEQRYQSRKRGSVKREMEGKHIEINEKHTICTPNISSSNYSG